MSYDEHLISMAGGDGEPDALDLDAIQARAEKQSAAHAKMIEIGYGIGRLGVDHPDMYDDMGEWDDLTHNDHADTVLALLALVREQQARIERVRALCAAEELRRTVKAYVAADEIRAALEPTP